MEARGQEHANKMELQKVESIEKTCVEVYLSPGVNGLVDINAAIKRKTDFYSNKKMFTVCNLFKTV